MRRRGSIGLQVKMEIPEPIPEECHWNSRPAVGDGFAGDGRAAESSEENEMQDGSTKLQARGWNQDTLREKYQTGRRGREVQMSTCRLRVLAGRRGALHRGMRLASAMAKDGELRHFDAEQAFFKASVDEGICI